MIGALVVGLEALEAYRRTTNTVPSRNRPVNNVKPY